MKPRYKPRHKWGDSIDNPYTKQQKCVKCGLFRFMALGSWLYSEEEVSESNPFPETRPNAGCITQLVNKEL